MLQQLLWCALLCLCTAWVQGQTYNLTGKVTDEMGKPLAGATVLLESIHKGAISNANGAFELANIPQGNYQLKASFVGYKTEKQDINLKKDLRLSLSLQPALETLQEVLIEDSYAEVKQRQDSRSLELVDNDYLKQHRGGSLMSSLERLPGVSTLSIGSGQSKPVIRGLGFNRVLVVQDGTVHQGQQWGMDHGLEIDQYAADRVTVVKGPGSLVHGSGGIGGIVQIDQAAPPQPHSLGGAADLNYKSNNTSVGGSVWVQGRREHWFASARLSATDYGDFRVATNQVAIYNTVVALDGGAVRNTAGNEQAIHGTVGYQKGARLARMSFSRQDMHSGFFANAAGLEPLGVDVQLHDNSQRDIHDYYQKVRHTKLAAQLKGEGGAGRWEVNLAWQDNYRREFGKYDPQGQMPNSFPDSLGIPANLEKLLHKQIATAGLQWQTWLANELSVRMGINAEYQQNDIDGRGFLTPGFERFTGGAYLYAQKRFGEHNSVNAGLRYDMAQLNTHAYTDWFAPYAQRAWQAKRNYNSTTWAVGYNHHQAHFSFKANAGKSFRLPIAKELAANGFNAHMFRVEVGRMDLQPEVSYQLDLAPEWQHTRFAVGLSPFVNYFANYIYLMPTPGIDELTLKQVYRYSQTKVLRYGGELHAHYKLLKTFKLGLIAEYVWAKQLTGDKKGFPLPFTPPINWVFNANYTPQSGKRLVSPYVSLDMEMAGKQSHIVPPERETPAYTLWHLSMGTELCLGKQHIKISLQIKNLLDRDYLKHTSYYRLVGMPEAGRNFIVGLHVPF